MAAICMFLGAPGRTEDQGLDRAAEQLRGEGRTTQGGPPGEVTWTLKHVIWRINFPNHSQRLATSVRIGSVHAGQDLRLMAPKGALSIEVCVQVHWWFGHSVRILQGTRKPALRVISRWVVSPPFLFVGIVVNRDNQ